MEQASPPPPKRPKLVWVIFVFYVFSLSYTALSFYLIFSGSLPLTVEERQYFNSLTTLDYTFTGIISLLNLAGAIALFRLRSVAPYLLTTALGFGLAYTLVHATRTSFAAVLGGPGAVGTLIGYAIGIGIIAYAWMLTSRGVLR